MGKYKIGLTGTVSTGKTTLIKELSKLPEFKDYNISVERSKYLNDLGVPVNKDSTYLGQQIFAAERASELIKDNGLLTDRTIIDVMAFTNLSNHYSLSSYKKRQMFDAWFPMIGYYDYIFYVSPEGVDIEDNGIRAIDPTYRNNIDNEIKKILNDEYVEYFEIYGSTKERIEQVMNIIR